MSCLHEFSLRMHTLVCKHASPASKLCSQDMRIACSARMCGRPAATPYPGLRPSAAVPYPGVRPSKAGLRPYLRVSRSSGMWARTSFLFGEFLPNLKNEISPQSFNFRNKITQLYAKWGKIVTEKNRDPLYSTFLKIFTKKKIFLKSEAPKALYSSHSFIVSALINNLSFDWKI